MLLAEFKVLRIINAYAALPVKHLIRKIPVTEYIKTMCCTPKYIYCLVFSTVLHVYSYTTGDLIKVVECNIKKHIRSELKYCNGIVHLSYRIANYVSTYMLIDAETHTVINTFDVKKITYTHYEVDGVVSEDKYNPTYITARCIYCASSYEDMYIAVYYFKHRVVSYKIIGDILIVYSTVKKYIYYIDMLETDVLNNYIMVAPHIDAAHCDSVALRLGNVLYLSEFNGITVIDLNKKTSYVIKHTAMINNMACLTPAGNLLVGVPKSQKNKSPYLYEYF
jgi:hypothetical protein